MKDNPRKVRVRYRDSDGRERTKNCGNAKGLRACLSWLKREGFELLSKEAITGSK